MKIAFTIPGRPQGKARPRFNSKTRRTYTPKQTQEYEAYVIWHYLKTAQSIYFTGALCVDIKAYFKIPKNFKKAQYDACISKTMTPVIKPDCDNIAKIILDALNDTAYKDDAQVTQLSVAKFYGANPRVEVVIYNNPI